MARKPEQPSKPIIWEIYRAAAKARWIGEVEAADEAEAIAKAAEQFNQPATKLMAVRRR
jgi:hypothetical protein